MGRAPAGGSDVRAGDWGDCTTTPGPMREGRSGLDGSPPTRNVGIRATRSTEPREARMGRQASDPVARKPIETLIREMKGGERLHRVLGPVALTALGVGATIGAGIFVLTGEAAYDYAGPSLIVSFLLAGLGCGLAALCYSELA